MDITSARLLIENLLDRIELDPATGKYKLGTISSKERVALEVLLGAEPSASVNAEPSKAMSSPAPTVAAQIGEAPADTPTEPFASSIEPVQPLAAPAIALNLSSLDRTQADDPNVTMCLDFGTAMSKAFAIEGYSTPVELALGQRAGASGYPVDSSLFISDDGILYFGPQAVKLGTDAAAFGRARFDSPKSRLSMGEQLDIDKAPIKKEINPVEETPVTEGELITLYLGYLTDLACSELEAQGHSRYCARRFARPCWSDDRNKWAEPLLRRMLAQAQILADTFHGQWHAGIPLARAKQAVAQLRELSSLPHYLLKDGIPEPVAAAASLMITDEAQRQLFMVVDVGAGTTDFGLFLLQSNPDKDICRVRIVPETIKVLEQAGNRVDDLLKFYILEHENIDKSSPEGEHNLRFLQSTIRLHKEALFRDGRVMVPLANGSRALIELSEFLPSSRVKNFSDLLQQELMEVLESAGGGYLDLMRDGYLNVVLTGGGAELPMIQKLANGVIEVHGRTIMRKQMPHVPGWIKDNYPQFAPQYPQLAVAIGGANPDLPEMARSFADFKGLARSAYAA